MESNNWLAYVILNESASTTIFIMLYFRSRLHIISTLIISVGAPLFILICLAANPSCEIGDQILVNYLLVGLICIVTIIEQYNYSAPIHRSEIENQTHSEKTEA
jgi:hypothetical protein